MKPRERETAVKFGIFNKVEKLEADLLKINGVVEVDFDLDGYYDNIKQVIILTKYDIPAGTENYFEKRCRLKSDVVAVAKENGLVREEDEIEDHGEHFYFVFRTNDASWHPAENDRIFDAALANNYFRAACRRLDKCKTRDAYMLAWEKPRMFFLLHSVDDAVKILKKEADTN